MKAVVFWFYVSSGPKSYYTIVEHDLPNEQIVKGLLYKLGYTATLKFKTQEDAGEVYALSGDDDEWQSLLGHWRSVDLGTHEVRL